MTWQFATPDPETREKTALRLIAILFFGLTVYITIDSILALTTAHPAGHSPASIILAAASLVIMPLSSWAERHAGLGLGSASVVSDSKQTLTCATSPPRSLPACC